MFTNHKFLLSGLTVAVIALTSIAMLSSLTVQVTAAHQGKAIEPAEYDVVRLSRASLTHSELPVSVTDTTTTTVMLPLVLRGWPPIPHQPTLSSISNPDGDGNYTANWVDLPERLADTYTLEEARDADFTTNVQTVCTVPQQYCQVTNRLAGTYYYRVQGCTTWGCGPYSNVESATVLLPGTPVLNAIDNADGDANYMVGWSAAPRAAGYMLEEDTDPNFGTPATVYQGGSLSWAAAGKAPATYYYRVKASGPTGQSGWSNVQSVNVPVPSPVVRILSNHYAYEDILGDLHIIGEVQNDTGNHVEFVKIPVAVYNSSGQVIDTDYTYMYLDSLAPGQKTCFHLWLDSYADWAYYQFQIVTYWSDTEPLPPLTVLNDYGLYDAGDGGYDVFGEVRNNAEVRVEYVSVVGTLYNGAGKTVGCWFEYVSGTHLDPGQIGPFDIGFGSYNRDYADVTSHRVQADGLPQSSFSRLREFEIK